MFNSSIKRRSLLASKVRNKLRQTVTFRKEIIIKLVITAILYICICIRSKGIEVLKDCSFNTLIHSRDRNNGYDFID